MIFDPDSPLTFWSALNVAVGALGIIALGAWTIYFNLQGQISEVRSEVSTLRADTREDFHRLNDKIDAMGARLDAKIDAISSKTDEKLDKLTAMIIDMRVEQAKKES
ncbi:putative PurR-regulated permease PerM [Erwinia toletana]|uniref:PurR-regulated permease PerM n=1 Tax=Winslowiella toletana TaxID=92490 RepID=A0ABS4PCY3_9GAMM|nr:hypothetical protein [Winslowiella toletana]MBP2169975.1 putative PurR-regulated permease PerM [Winslowiella toletana]